MAHRQATSDAAAEGLDYGQLSELLGYNLRRAQLRAFQDFSETMAPFELSPGQLGLLLLVEANPGLNQTTLARAMGLDRSTIVALIDGLEARGLIARTPSPGDRRSHALMITAPGEAFLGRIRPHLDDHEARIAGDLSAAERRILADLLKRLNGL